MISEEKTGRCPFQFPFSLLKPCECSVNHGSLAGTIDITCPSEVATSQWLRDIISRTHFFTTAVDTFTLTGSSMGGTLDMEILEPLEVAVLNMANNRFNFINTHAFAPSSNSLKVVSLAQNEINFFRFVSILYAPNLFSLNLAGNQLTVIPEEAFEHPALKYLDLSNNKINKLSKRSFYGLKEIQRIDLSGNQIPYLTRGVFEIMDRNTENIIEINLRRNNISSISFGAFNSLAKML